MELTPDMVTDLILKAFEKGIARGRELAAAGNEGPQTPPFGVDLRTGRIRFGTAPCEHRERTRAVWPSADGESTVNGPEQCANCDMVTDAGDTL